MRSSCLSGRTIALSLTLLSLPWIASAGLNDPPPAALPLHVYSVPGAMKSGTLDTVISCTSVDTAGASLKIQYYDRLGTLLNPSGPSFGLQPGESLHFATGSLASFALDVSTNTGNFTGSARVVATTKKLLCAAFIVASSSDPPVTMMQLPVVRKVLQKGD